MRVFVRVQTLDNPTRTPVSYAAGSFGVMIFASFFCALGCFLRGIAQSVPELYGAAVVLGLGGAAVELVVLMYVSAVTPVHKRSTVISGFVIQTVSLRILAKAVRGRRCME